jgi:outer membrane protein assembly factor BamB
MNLRLWPGVALASITLLVMFGAPLVIASEGALVGALGGVAGGALILLWWLFFSRAPWLERIGALAMMALATYLSLFIVHPSIRGGAMGRMLPILLAPPAFGLLLVAALVITRRASVPARRVAIAVGIVIACGYFAVLRTDGLWAGKSQLALRWTPTAEEKLLARADAALVPATPAAAPAVAAPVAPPDAVPPAKADAGAASGAPVAAPPAAPTPAPLPDVRWSGFRGPARDGAVRGVTIATDWTKSPPVELWRRPIGPGWSSFAVAGEMIYTQEQRGEDEIVASYSLVTGKPLWVHKDPVRFYESNGGAGPRSTPTIDKGRLYTMGATGILNALDARTGRIAWSRDTVTDTAIKLPGWGITGSPVVVGDVVIVAVSGALAGYDKATGDKRWSRKSGGGSYSSPQVTTVDGVEQVLLMGGAGLISVMPVDGTVLWEHHWEGVPIVQPAQIEGGDFLVTTADAMGALGIRRIAVTHSGSAWNAAERWTSKGLKPYFNDYVVHKGYAYGFDGTILACIDLADGARKWKGGRYGNGQFILLRDQDLLVVLSDEGELALVSATPGQFTELGRFKAIDGKTWNHPVLVGNLLLVRNGEEMAAFRLP